MTVCSVKIEYNIDVSSGTELSVFQSVCELSCVCD